MTESSNIGNHYRKQFTLKWQLKFIAMICFTGLLFVMKIVTGHITNSMALVADSFHMITDFAALTIGFIALRLANSKTSLNKNLSSDKFTFGWVRAEVLGGLINTVFLLALCFSILVHSLKRFIQPENITKPIPVLIVGVVSLVVNLLGLLMFRKSRENCWTLCLNCLKKTKKMKDSSRNNEVEGVSLIHGDQLHGIYYYGDVFIAPYTLKLHKFLCLNFRNLWKSENQLYVARKVYFLCTCPYENRRVYNLILLFSIEFILCYKIH